MADYGWNPSQPPKPAQAQQSPAPARPPLKPMEFPGNAPAPTGGLTPRDCRLLRDAQERRRTTGLLANKADDAGVLIDGTVPTRWLRYLNLNDIGSFLKHDKLDLKYDGTAVFSGVAQDPNGKLLVDFPNKLITVQDEQATPKDRVYVGRMGAGADNYGLMVLDVNGATIVDMRSSNMKIQDSAQKFVADFTNAQATVTDNQATPKTRVKLGKVGGGLADYGLQVFDDAGNALLDFTGVTQLVQQGGTGSPTAGILLRGTRPGGWTTYLDLTASGASPILHHPGLDLNADGTAVFTGTVQAANLSTAGKAAILLHQERFSHSFSASLTTITSYTIPAGVLSNDGDTLRVTFYAFPSANASSVQLLWGASALLNIAKNASIPLISTEHIIRTGAAAQDTYTAEFQSGTFAQVGKTETLANAIPITVKAAAVAGSGTLTGILTVELLQQL